ncbi:MAG: hypothetical protein LBG59_08860 [Candidatus Peribacteria bacterium]|jgi:hypothetical protein|nr:hypothetical protein [Candidatus Peribacteria bacterium]
MNKSFLNGLRAPRVLALVMVACFTCLVVSSCTKDENVVGNVFDTEIISILKSVNVERSLINGIYLAFESDSVLQKLDDYLIRNQHNNEKISDIVEHFAKQGFLSLGTYEKENNVPLSECYADPTMRLLFNSNKLIKIGRLLYQEKEQNNQKELYLVNEQGKIDFVEAIPLDTQISLKSTGTCNATTESYTKEGHFAMMGSFYGPTMRMGTQIKKTTSSIVNDKIILFSFVDITSNGTNWTAATATLQHYYEFSVETVNGGTSGVVSPSSPINSVSSSSALSWETTVVSASTICLGYVYCTFNGTRADGKQLSHMLRME